MVHSTVKTLDIGVREYEGESYLFIANTNGQDARTQITIHDYPKQISEFKDAITGQVLGAMSEGNTFNLHVHGYDVKLIKFEGSAVKKANATQPHSPSELRVVR